MTRYVKKVAVLGSGVMGSNIACHLANIGFDVLLLDIVTPGLSDQDLENKTLKNQLVDQSLLKAIKSKPAPLFKSSFANRIKTGNFEDDLPKIKSCDWILEAIIEDPKIKYKLFKEVEKYRKEGAMVSSNTSGIPMSVLSAGHSEDFKKHFLGTHFFNPPRYLDLIEIIPGPKTDPELADFFIRFGREYLGKETILCKDTPAFIANRVGVYSILRILELTEKYNLDIETVDTLTGPIIGRPKTGTFRLQDMIGVDTGFKVLKSVSSNCPDDTYLVARDKSPTPPYIKFLLDNNFLGQKSGQGFYMKTNQKDDFGKTVVLGLDLKTLEYRPKKKITLQSILTAKKIPQLQNRLQELLKPGDTGNDFTRAYFAGLFSDVSNKIPEISDQLYSIDAVMKGGYAWDLGPFEYWDMIGLKEGLALVESFGLPMAEWVKEMGVDQNPSFYKNEDGRQFVYDPLNKKYIKLPGSGKVIILKNLENKKVFSNTEASVFDIGDGVLCLEFTSKNQVLGEGTGEAMHKALDMAVEEGWRGIVIGHNRPQFTVGANLMLVATNAYQKEWGKLRQLVKGFQDLNMRLRYSPVPVVTATRGYVFGGGIEMSMHADGVAAAAESYIGLVEAGVGIIPGGGGTKEFALRLSDTFYEGDVMIPKLIEMFRTIAMAQVATSADMAFDYKFLLPHRDQVVLNAREHIHKAKSMVLNLAKAYLPPSPKKVKVLGRTGLATLQAAISEFLLGSFITEHDALVANHTAFVMCGGDLSYPQEVSEQYLLNLEQEAFLSLCGEKKTLDRIQHMLQFNKPLRN
jgi:3-hydroxyacyl-CoA dehydrogenase